MKKVGILTFHTAHNYGAVLQCYALQEVLKSLNYDVSIIDYRLPIDIDRYSIFQWYHFKDLLKNYHLRGALGCFRQVPKRYAQSKAHIYKRFRQQYLNMTKRCTMDRIPQDFDIYIVGSDQMWGLHCIGKDTNVAYFGGFKHKKESKVYGYAISSTHSSVHTIGKNKLIEAASNFAELSFRENSIKTAVEELTGGVYRQDIDPTLLTSASTWDNIINDKWSKERYVLMYQVRTLKNNKGLIREKAEAVAKQLDCKVIDIMDEKYSPDDFVSLFKYAQYVVTSSFHGTAFSLIFERPLYSVKLNDGHDSRYVDLLNSIGAEKMLLDKDDQPIVQNIDYGSIRKQIIVQRENSLDYLKTL